MNFSIIPGYWLFYRLLPTTDIIQLHYLWYDSEWIGTDAEGSNILFQLLSWHFLEGTKEDHKKPFRISGPWLVFKLHSLLLSMQQNMTPGNKTAMW